MPDFFGHCGIIAAHCCELLGHIGKNLFGAALRRQQPNGAPQCCSRQPQRFSPRKAESHLLPKLSKDFSNSLSGIALVVKGLLPAFENCAWVLALKQGPPNQAIGGCPADRRREELFAVSANEFLRFSFDQLKKITVVRGHVVAGL